MSERTFREPSPGRPPASNGLPAAREVQPPLPQLPQDYSNIPPIPKKSSRRSASIDETQIRKEPLKNQTPNRTFVAAMPTSRPVTNPSAAAARRVVSGAPELERTDSQNSVNFSYPGRARPTSPPPQKQRTALDREEKPATPTTPLGISPAEVRSIQYQVAQTAQQPVRKKKQRADRQVAAGSHLQSGTLNAKPTVTPLAPGPPATEEDDSHVPATKGQNNARLTGQASHFPSSPTSPTSDSFASDSDSASATDRVKARRVQRASGVLQKQPSVVREDWEGEQEGDEEDETPSPVSAAPSRIAPHKRRTAEANVSRKIEEPTNTSKADAESTTPAPSTSTLVAPETRRGSSLSPSRSTRFSNRLSSDMTEGRRHEPPPRSISPRKPALKHSPSPKILAADAGRHRDPSLSPSEGTDISADGAPRRKKAAHVSFDSQPAIVGTSAEPSSPSSPQVVSPQNREQGKKWFGTKAKPQNRAVLEDSDDEDSMKPRPQLPTFGSVRKGRNIEIETPSNQKVIPSPSSSPSSSNSSFRNPTTMETSISSDYAIGGLISQQATLPKLVPLSPVPAGVASLEGTGLDTDTESVYSVDEVRKAAAPAHLASSHLHVPASKAMGESADVPSIAVQPATPGAEEEVKNQDHWLVEVPGGFPPTTVDVSGPAPATQAASVHAAVTQQPEDDDIEMRQERMPSIEEEDEDHDSIYSDAAEDLSDLEGDGFGSINAIVYSPVVSSPGVRSEDPDSPLVTMPQKDVRPENDKRTASWDDTGARWKDLADNAKRSTLQPAAPITEVPAQQPEKTNVKTATNSKKQVVVPPTPVDRSLHTSKQVAAAPPSTTRTGRNDQPSAIRKSMRSDPQSAAPTTLRSTTRTSAGGAPKTMRTSMQASAPPAARATPVNPPATAQGTLQKGSLPAAPKPRQALPPVNNDSDSESSFKRRRRAKATDPNKYTMRRSMRAGDVSGPAQAPTAQQRREVRSLSPAERRPFSSAGGQATMRTSMRGSMDDTPTLRNTNGGKRSSSLFGRGKAKSPTRPMSATGFGGGTKSRFADSDDEADTKPNVFKSRFGDSSDEDDELRPVRGIPRTTKDDDSTDLEDSSDEEGRKRGKTIQQPKTSAAVPNSLPATNLERPTSPSSPGGTKKRGFLGRFRKSKDEIPTAGERVSSAQVNGDTPSEGKHTQTASTAALGFKSDAEKEALIEQTRQKLEAAKERPTSPPGTPGKLQRRATPQRILSDSWPLPPKVLADMNERPHTSDGPAASAAMRPELEDGQPSSPMSKSSSQEAGSAFGRTGKKKRFPMLRKAFGLRD